MLLSPLFFFYYAGTITFLFPFSRFRMCKDDDMRLSFLNGMHGTKKGWGKGGGGWMNAGGREEWVIEHDLMRPSRKLDRVCFQKMKMAFSLKEKFIILSCFTVISPVSLGIEMV